MGDTLSSFKPIAQILDERCIPKLRKTKRASCFLAQLPYPLYAVHGRL
jgi:hypothetical protein